MTPLRRSPAAGHASLLVLVLSQERADTSSSHLRGGKAYVARKLAAWPHSLQCSSTSAWTSYRAWDLWWDASIQQWGGQGQMGHCCPGHSVCWVAGSGAFQQRQW